jgi:hypothetical protein
LETFMAWLLGKPALGIRCYFAGEFISALGSKTSILKS